MKIASASLENAFAIAEVHVRSWQAAYAGIVDAGFLKRMSVEDRAHRWRDIIQKAESQTLVAHRGGDVVGFVSFGKCRDEGSSECDGEIWALYAPPEVWGQGIGRELLGRAVQELRSLGHSEVRLWVLSQNHRGVKFYEAFGFRRVQGSEKLFELGGHQVEEVCLLLQDEAKAFAQAARTCAMDIRVDDLTHPAVHALLEEHLQSMYEISPPESVHALDLERLRSPAIKFWSAWQGDCLVGIGALKELDREHGEIKSMRTPNALRRQGAGRAMLAHIINEASSRGYNRLSLETGAMAQFEPAQALYMSFGFSFCGPFGGYVEDPNSVFMSKLLGSRDGV